MGVGSTVAKIINDWWTRIKTHQDPADIYLDQLQSLDQLSPTDALDIINAIQGKLDRGEIPGDPDKIAQLRTELAGLYNKYSAQPPTVAVAPPKEALDTAPVEDMLKKAVEALDYKVKQWKDRWWQEALKRFGRHGSPFFAEGGQPILAINQARVALKASGLYDFIEGYRGTILGMLFNIKRGVPGVTLEDAKKKISEMYTEYTKRESKASQEILAFMKTYDLFLGMQNFTNLVNQYVVGKFIFGTLDKLIVNPIRWLARMTKVGGQPEVLEQLKKAEYLRNLMIEKRHPWAAQAYNEAMKKWEAQRMTTTMIHGPALHELPSAPAPPALTTEELQYLAKFKQLPSWYVEGLPDDVKKLLAVGGMTLIGQVGAELKAHAADIINEAIPGGIEGFIDNTLKPYVEQGGRDIDGQIDKWLKEHGPELEEKAEEEAAKIADKEIEAHPIPTVENAAQLEAARREAWARRVITYYNEISQAREFGSMVQLLGLLEAEASGAQTPEDRAWIDGLIAAAEQYVKEIGHQQGRYPELGVRRSESAFQIPVKANQ